MMLNVAVWGPRPDSLMYFVTSFGQPSSNDTLPALVFRADAALENPNFLGGRAQNGNFEAMSVKHAM